MKGLLYLMLLIFLITSASAQQTTIFLVRHAEKDTTVTDDPGLTSVGNKRAADLAFLLKDVKIDRIYSTPFVRTQQTVSPLAKEKNEKVSIYNPLDTKGFMNIISSSPGQVLFFAGHSNTIPAMVNALTNSEKYSDLEDWEYDLLYMVVITPDDTNVFILHYGIKSIAPTGKED